MHAGGVDPAVGLVPGQGGGVASCLDQSIKQAPLIQQVTESASSVAVVLWSWVIHFCLHMTLAKD